VVIAASTAFGSIFAVSGCTSAKIILAPISAAVACVAIKVMGGVIISSPGSMPMAA
jgi:hypothetical protein